jgi:hypothetical protein
MASKKKQCLKTIIAGNYFFNNAQLKTIGAGFQKGNQLPVEKIKIL